MKCILHIGTEKTGTTLLQDWLYDNKEVLNINGIYLSENLGETNNRLLPTYFQSSLDDWAVTNGIANEEEKKLYFKGFLDRFTTEITNASKTHHTFVITSEHFHSRLRQKEEIEELHSVLTSLFDKLEVICYFREQYDMVVSVYSTLLKADNFSELDDFVEQAKPENYYYNFLKIADNWSDVFGRNNCNFRLYDRDKFVGNDIRLDFLSAMKNGLNSEQLNMGRASSNKSLYLLQTAAFRAVNRNIPFWRSDKIGINLYNRFVKNKVSELHSLKFGNIVSSKAHIIMDRFKETNKIFFEKYFTSEVSFPSAVKESTGTVTCDEAVIAIEEVLELGIKLNQNSEIFSLSDLQINSLRDISLRLYENNPNSISDSLALMKIALIFRPDGSIIKSKIKEWSDKLNSKNDE